MVICPLCAQSNTYSERLDKLGVSPRSIALGKATSSTYLQALDVWLNSALLGVQKTKYSAAYAHTDAFKGISKADVFVLTIKPDSSKISFGFGAYQLSNGGVFDTRYLELQDGTFDFSQLNTFTNRDYGLKWFLSKSMNEKFSIGSSFDFDFVSLGDFAHATAIGFGLNAVYELDSTLHLSANLHNPFGKFYFWNQNSSLLQTTYFGTNNYIQVRSMFVQLPGFQFGADKYIYINPIFSSRIMAKISLGFSSNSNTILLNKNMALDAGFGCETSIKEKLYFRFGVSDFQHNSLVLNKINSQLSFGLGVDLGSVQLDYALGNFTKTAIPAQKNLLSLTYDFEKFLKNNAASEPTRF